MGATQAAEFAAAAGEGEISMRQAVTWHLSANHFPPVHTIFVPIAMRAIRLAAAEDFDETITLPSGVVLSVTEVVDQLHLWEFVDNADAVPFDDDVDG